MNKQRKNRTDLSLWYKNSAAASTLTILLILIIMSTALAIAAPAFLRPNNLLNTARNFSAIAVAGIGVSVVILTGNIDISVGSVYGLAGVTVALLMKSGMGVVPAVLLGMAVGALCGMVNGMLVVYFRLPSYIATLGMMQIVRGVCYILTRGYPVSGMADSFKWIGQEQMLGVPVPVYFMLLFALVFAVFRNRTKTGRRIFAMGGNEEATRISGVNTRRLKILCFVLAGVCAAFAGIINASKVGVAQPTAGNGFEMDAIASVIIGGSSMAGGVGTVVGTLIGSAIMGVLRNALVLLSVESYWQTLVMGVVIIFAVTIDQLRKARR
ncbi:MAG: ABC transporter permease [Clostridiales bacterium]|nr:ABC transporter permease [Clostridiales bacterium]